MEKEIWKPLIYKDIKDDHYIISNTGRIMNKITNKELFGCKPLHEKGYVRVTLQTNNGYKKFSLHRLVIGIFYKILDEYEVNHIDGNKLNNNLNNLEYIDRLGNALHAKNNMLYESCEDHYKASLTNNEVEFICSEIQNGKSNIEIIRELDLNIKRYMHIISLIRNRKSWTNISKKYKWDIGIIYKKYTKDDIYMMCYYIYIKHMKLKDILKIFPQYTDKKKLYNVLKKIKQFKLYKSIILDVMGSETIENYTTKFIEICK